ncbi:mercury methylation ferredoxin HgcB [Candidatus Acidulodesulfobacterium sp. H_13]|uniref:mercury methylation ferredoxin HgcB n=1 Tax=Candidatus Acidulodesulfobacterium sp. H_13 TaxID=3395470 RepID=UPI003AF81C40
MKYLKNVSSLSFFPDNCINCMTCIDVCPHGVFFIENKRVAVCDKDSCMECAACILNCEYGAITVNYGVGCASGIINGMISGGTPSCDCDTVRHSSNVVE